MEIIDYNAVGARLKEKRKDSNLTQAKMSEILGVSLKHYGEVERGETGLSVELAARIKAEFNISLDYIFLGELPNPENIEIINKMNSVPVNRRQELIDVVNGIIAIILHTN